MPLRLSRPQWREVLRWFVRDAASADIARETGLERKRVLRALMIVRQAILRAAQYGVQKPAPARSSAQVTLIGLRIATGRASAEVVPQAEAEQLVRWLRNRENHHAHPPRHLRRYMAVIHRGRLQRLAVWGAERVPFGPIEAFWAYVQRQLRGKGGIRRERLDLYLASVAWRYNHRKIPPAEQVEELLGLLGRPSVVSRTGLSRWRKKA